MKDRTKKWLIVAGGLVICAVLVVLIGKGFARPEVPDDVDIGVSEASGEVTVSPEDSQSSTVVVKPDTQKPADSGGAVSSGTEQTIQSDVSKPPEPEKPSAAVDTEKPHEVPTDPALTNPDVKPSDPPEAKPTPPDSSQNSGGEKKDGKVYVPGFGWIDDVGEGQGSEAKDMYENGNKIGIMG